MENSQLRYDVIVHKANIPLAKGESINQYMNNLREAASTHLAKKLNLDPKLSSSYMIEAYANSAVFDVYKRMGENMPAKYSYYAVKYDRGSDGKFSFSDTTEVERVISFEPKQQLAVTKSSQQEHDEAAGTVEKSAPVPRAGALVADGWMDAKKSISWSGVL